MLSNKSFLAVLAAMFIGGASAFTGTATLGISPDTTTSCGCGADNGPFEVAIPAALVGSNVCCDTQVNLAFGDETTTAVFGAIYNAGAGTENIALSADAFSALSPGGTGTTLSPVTWSFF
ncbi:hypothetical protein C8R44DRAFT_743085 [Mycena epipterygia]|nr:hypothetical protein C8R44DRAFT_743085 [Mycena epipterygia]